MIGIGIPESMGNGGEALQLFAHVPYDFPEIVTRELVGRISKQHRVQDPSVTP